MRAKKFKQFGINVKRIRESRNLTQKQLADLAETTVTNIKNIENGKANPSLNFLVKMAKAMSVKITDLTKGI